MLILNSHCTPNLPFYKMKEASKFKENGNYNLEKKKPKPSNVNIYIDEVLNVQDST